MLMDERLQVCSKQTIPAATPTLSENVIDLASDQWPAGRDIGEGNPWYFLVICPTVAAVKVEVVASNDSGLAAAIPQVIVDQLSVGAGDHLLVPVVFPHRRVIPGSAMPDPSISVWRYLGVRITTDAEGDFDVYATLAGQTISPIAYPASTES